MIILKGDATHPDALEFGITDGTGTDSGWGVSSGATAVESSAWVHVAATYDRASGLTRVFLNGAMVGEATAPYEATSGSYPFWVGADPKSGTRQFDGNVDEVFVWSAPRTEAEIACDMLYPPTGSETGLALAWRFDEGTGQDVMDATATGSNGRLGSDAASDPADPAWTTTAPY